MTTKLFVCFNPTIFGIPLEQAKAQVETLRGINQEILAYAAENGVAKFLAEIEALTPPGSRVATKPEPKVDTPKVTVGGKKPNQKVSFQDLERFLGNQELPLLAVKKELSETFHGTTNAVEKMVRRYVRLGRVRKTIRNGVMYVSMASVAPIKRPTKEKEKNAKSNGAYGAPNSRVFQIEALIKANGGSYPLYDLPKALPLGTYRLNRVVTDAVENGYLKIEEKDGTPILTRTSTPIPTTYSTKGGKGGQNSPRMFSTVPPNEKKPTGVKFLGPEPAYLST